MLGRVAQETSGATEPRVRERHIQAPEAIERLAYRRLLLLPFGHIALDGESALVPAQLLGQIGEPVA